jgi:hypothetical protein
MLESPAYRARIEIRIRPGNAAQPFLVGMFRVLLVILLIAGVAGCRAAATDSHDERRTVRKLDPDLRAALILAAADSGFTFHITSGWRSRAHQERLFEEAVTRYGSEQEASRWVARPGTSVHEHGDAVDLGPDRAVAWLSTHGAKYGLCQIYGNEPWHYELRPAAVGRGCPPTYPDPTYDPRMQ